MKRINGENYKNLIDFGVRNLEANRVRINELNVFPVPDGDTGTNMALTLKNGFKAVADGTDFLPSVCKDFGNAIVLGARGNSGVILSQFLKGVSEVLGKYTEVEIPVFISALGKGVDLAYESVAHPVEGTMLTVLKDIFISLKEKENKIQSFSDLASISVAEGSLSLERTTDLLPVLKKANVVDSGGAGVVCFFEGIKKYFCGENVEVVESLEPYYIDYSVYNRGSSFDLGFCTEILLQLLDCKEKFNYDEFKKTLKNLGGSLVLSEENDKVKIHLHTMKPEKVMIYCHRFGEFLSLKIENMTIQHNRSTQKFLQRKNDEKGSFSVVAVATDKILQQTFSEMGADVVILSKEAPTSADFIDAFKLTGQSDILVLPDCNNSIMSANQAALLCSGYNVKVLNCTSAAKCYAALASVDFEESDLSKVEKSLHSIIDNLQVVKFSKATKDVEFDNKAIMKNDYFAFCNNDVVGIDSSLEALVLKTIKRISLKMDISVVTIFGGKSSSDEQKDRISNEITSLFDGVEVFFVPTEDTICDITISLE